MHLLRSLLSRSVLSRSLLSAAALLLVCALPLAHAQAPSGAAPSNAPANATGLCNDGSYWTGTTRNFSCRGHKGLKTWYGTPAATATAPGGSAPPVPVAKPTPPPTAVPAAKPTSGSNLPAVTPATAKAASNSSKQQAAGGGNGQVWVNTPSKVYHCPGDRYYGKTKEGQYMSEAEAKAMGARPDRGAPCPK